MHPMRRWIVERKLTDTAARLRKSREELAVVDEQLLHFNDEADDARLRALVAETPIADHENRQSQRHADAMRSARYRLVERIGELERQQDALLDKLRGAT